MAGLPVDVALGSMVFLETVGAKICLLTLFSLMASLFLVAQWLRAVLSQQEGQGSF